ncbi:MAG: DmsC/YnfH family molybdoenzyme membrane anchor subunit [Casimicrobiaceae bacterium]
MKPALSVVFFTVASGAGLGLLAVLGVRVLFGLPWLMPETLPWAGALGLALTIAGLASSTLHLANPRNAWRAFSRFRTSWLSREAVFAVAFLIVAFVFVLSLASNATGDGLRRLLAALTIVLAWKVLVCTAMIYASLKPIRQWHTRWTPVAYFVLGHLSGALLLLALARYDASNSIRIAHVCLVLILAAALVKAGYWLAHGRAAGAPTIEQAIGVAQGVRPPVRAGAPSVMQARLLDAGHTGRTFLTDEFGFRLARRYRALLLAAFWLFGIVVPFAWVASGWWETPIIVGACILHLAGLLAERALFFADARHTVRLYHGDART